MRDPLVLPLAAVICGLLIERAFPFSPTEAAWAIAAFLILATAAAVARSVATNLSNPLARACTLLALLFFAVLESARHRPGPRPVIDARPREIVVLEGCVVEPSAFSVDRAQFTLELEPGARVRVSQNFDEGDSPPASLHYGQRVEIEARIRPPHNFHNPGSFDYEGYLARQEIFWTAAIPRGRAPDVLPGACGSPFLSAVFRLREAAISRIERLYPDNAYNAGMMEAVLIGETSKLEKIWTENFRRTGTFHALVISGAHVAVLAAALLFLLRLSAVPEFAALVMTAIFAWIYAMVSGFSPPVIRAAGGFTLFLIARFFFRKPRVLNLLAAFTIAYLLWRPDELIDGSFQLSFLSVVAIAALAAPLIDSTFGPFAGGLRAIMDLSVDPHLEPKIAQFRVEIRLFAETVQHVCAWLAGRVLLKTSHAAILTAALLRLVLFLAKMCLISTVIQIGLALPMAEYFHRISFTGLSGNMVIVPLLEMAVPLGFAAVFTGWQWIADAAAWLLMLAAKTADWHARIEPSWRIVDPPAWLALAFVVSFLWLAFTIRHRFWRWPAGAAAFGSFLLLIWQPWPAEIVPGSLELTAIDVGQGDSLLVIFPQGAKMLIDGGGTLSYGRSTKRSNLDTGEDVVSPYLWSRRIRRLDVVAATHAHADHSAGLGAVLENFRPKELWVGANPSEALLEKAKTVGVRVIQKHAARVPESKFDYSGAQIEILAPPEGFDSKKPGNNDSLALRLSYGRKSMLLTGDLEKPIEQILLDERAPLKADVLKVGHHGSKTSTSPEFLDAIEPSIAVVSAGYQNSFGHPHPEVLARLAERHVATLRTDLDGLITVRTDGRNLQWEGRIQKPSGFAEMFEKAGLWGGFEGLFFESR